MRTKGSWETLQIQEMVRLPSCQVRNSRLLVQFICQSCPLDHGLPNRKVSQMTPTVQLEVRENPICSLVCSHKYFGLAIASHVGAFVSYTGNRRKQNSPYLFILVLISCQIDICLKTFLNKPFF